MAEVRKNKKDEKNNNIKKTNLKEETKSTKKKASNTDVEKKSETKKQNVKQKKSLWVRFRIFWHGVGSEFKKVNWPTKENMIKYSIATILFVVFLALFFFIIDVLFALVQTLI